LAGTLVSLAFPMTQLMATMSVIVLISPFLVILSALLIYPLELLISKFYQLKAKRKIIKLNVDIIGITGSYGKTSTKNILYSFLKNNFVTLATNKSYNTLNGVSKNVNGLLNDSYDYMIVEMGAVRSGDIEKLVNLTSPRYGIITGVAPQHIVSFKTIENIANEKIKLIENLPSDGVGIINGDDEYLRNSLKRYNCKLIKYGFNSENDYQARLISSGINGLKFEVKYQNTSVVLETLLLAKHNIYNILASFALTVELGVPINEIKLQCSMLEPTANRLSIEDAYGMKIIRDDYNSNLEGFKSSIEVLSYHNGRKILITPGIVDGGQLEDEINYQLGSIISNVCDMVYLIKTKGSIAIERSFKDLGFTNFNVMNSFKEAFEIVKTCEQGSTVLIENDINDYYKI
jgi:UDP-N-acetylmuramoyl-tripeptide--D-alanyl-D-alanine ligase